jgi:hypothetical protein
MRMRANNRFVNSSTPIRQRIVLFASTALIGFGTVGCTNTGTSANDVIVPERDSTQRVYANLQPGKPCSSGKDDDCKPSSFLHCVDYKDGKSPICDCPSNTEFSFVSGTCESLKLGTQPGDACGPSGEGEIPYAQCDPNRGLICTKPQPNEIDAVATCACAPGQTYSSRYRACVGAQLGEHAGDPCNLESSDAGSVVLCNTQRGLRCSVNSTPSTDSSYACRCETPLVWSENEGQCVKTLGACEDLPAS